MIQAQDDSLVDQSHMLTSLYHMPTAAVMLSETTALMTFPVTAFASHLPMTLPYSRRQVQVEEPTRRICCVGDLLLDLTSDGSDKGGCTNRAC